MSGLEAFYQDELDLSVEVVCSPVDLAAVSRNNSRPGLLCIIELVVGAVVQCGAKELYISRIMGLREAIQRELMVIIEKVIDKCEHHNDREESKENKKEYNKLRQEKNSLAQQVENLQKELVDMAKKLEETTIEREQLKSKNQDLENELTTKYSPRKVKGAQVDATLRELDEQLTQKEALIEELKTKNSEMKKQHEIEISFLKDELDVTHEKIIHLSKAESTLELYKKRLEDLNNLKKKLKEANEAKEALIEKLKSYEDENSDLTNLKQTIAFYKEQFDSEKERCIILTLSVDEKDKIIMSLKKQISDLDRTRKFNESKIKELLDENERLRFGMDIREGEESFSLSMGFQADYEEKILKLERENKELKNRLGVDNILHELSEQLDAAHLSRKVAEDKLANESKEKTSNVSKYQILNEEYSNYKFESEQKIRDLQNDVNILCTENSTLKQKLQEVEKEKNKLEYISTENEKLKAERDNNIHELRKLFKEKDELTHKLLENREEIHKLETLITQKEAFLKTAEHEIQRLESKAKEAKDSEKIVLKEIEVLKNKQSEISENQGERIKMLELERDIMMLNGEVSSLKLSIREKDDLIAMLKEEKQRKETEFRETLYNKEEALVTAHNEELNKLNNFLAQKDLEIGFLQKAKDELSGSVNKEMKLMSMVLHEVGLEIMRVNRNMQEDKLAYRRLFRN
jgi:chromosome segregation ATPase